MKNIFVYIYKFLSIVLLLTTLVACDSEKEIVSYVNSTGSFKIIGVSHPAPSFIGGIGFSGNLVVPSMDFRSKQLAGVLFFENESGVKSFIMKDSSGKYILIEDNKNQPQRHIKNFSNFLSLNITANLLTDFKFVAIKEKIELRPLKCVVFRWHSGGIKYYSFKSLDDGVSAFFDYNFIEKADIENSGFIKFTEWNSDVVDWPKIQSIDRIVAPVVSEK